MQRSLHMLDVLKQIDEKPKKTLSLGKVRDENYYWVSKNMDYQ